MVKSEHFSVHAFCMYGRLSTKWLCYFGLVLCLSAAEYLYSKLLKSVLHLAPHLTQCTQPPWPWISWHSNHTSKTRHSSLQVILDEFNLLWPVKFAVMEVVLVNCQILQYAISTNNLERSIQRLETRQGNKLEKVIHAKYLLSFGHCPKVPLTTLILLDNF